MKTLKTAEEYFNEHKFVTEKNEYYNYVINKNDLTIILAEDRQQVNGLIDEMIKEAKIEPNNLLKEIYDEWIKSGWGYNVNIKPKVEAYLKKEGEIK